MYKIIDKKFKEKTYGSEKFLENWPMLYVLENGKEAYIGESNHVSTRMKQHKDNPEKVNFGTVHFIYSNDFNQSVTFDYESKLIQLFLADEQFVITNKNSGLADKQYFEKEIYDAEFVRLWEKLRRHKLAKKRLSELENTDIFKYSPFKELNDSQRDAVDQIVEAVKEDKEQTIVVRGMPGSGKTIVAIFLMKLLRDTEEFKDKKIGLVIPPVSLRATLKSLFKRVYGLKATDVIGPLDVTKKKYDILLVDEAHRLHRYQNIGYMGSFKKAAQRIGLDPSQSDEMDFILKQCTCPIFFYDSAQSIGPSGIPAEEIRKKMKQQASVSTFTLETQMRVQGGNDYIQYIKDILFNRKPAKIQFNKYDLKIIESFQTFNELLYKKENEFTLCRMVAGYAWPWLSKNDKAYQIKDIEIEGIKKRWNNVLKEWVHTKTAIDEVGCIHSIQGYDLNYAFVIMGPDIYFDEKEQKIKVNPASYYDANGKKSASYEELEEFIKNIYYVLLTRGIKGTYIYVCDEKLRTYLKQFIDPCSN